MVSEDLGDGEPGVGGEPEPARVKKGGERGLRGLEIAATSLSRVLVELWLTQPRFS